MALGQFGLTTNGAAADLSITTAGTVVCTAITGLTGMQAFSARLDFSYGSGGTSGVAYLQSSLDGGNTWHDLAAISFAQVNKSVLLNFSGLTSKLTEVTPTDGAMTSDTAIDGLIGDQVRLKVISIGTYAGNTLLKGRMVAR